ncbi:MAG: hypothetical protein QOK05_1206 [Chloroflexota bacterium]|nr:hypothetical protein [Chloroflexota bacterium]
MIDLASLRVLAGGAVLLLTASCGPGSTTAAVTPSPKAVQQAELPNYNSRLGSNRVAAVVAARLGRSLYTSGQYWEVYLRSTPPALNDKYDPGRPEASTSAAATVTAAEVIMATESGASIKSFQAGGQAAEKQELTKLEADIRAAFPNTGTVTVRVFFGESFQYATAVFDHGQLTKYDARKTG